MHAENGICAGLDAWHEQNSNRGEMTVYMKFLSVLVMAASLCVSACADNSPSKNAETSDGKMTHNGSKSDAAGSSIADALKDKTMSGYESTTIGSAFDGYRYFAKKEWKATTTQNGKIYIDFIGWVDTKALDAASIKDGISARAVDVKFAINPDGSFFYGHGVENRGKG